MKPLTVRVTMRTPADVVRDTGELATLPGLYLRLAELAGDPRRSAEDLGRVIADDPALTARLLRLANDAPQGASGGVDTVSEALAVVGTADAADLALATSVMRHFDGVVPEWVDLESFWRHSVGVGIAARTLAVHRGSATPERLLVGGLLHDIGRLALLIADGPGMSRIISRARRTRSPLHDIERETLGYDHADVGRALLASWQLPAGLQEMAGAHHRPETAVGYPLECAIVHLADMIANALALGSSGEVLVPPPSATAWEIAEISPDALPSLLADIDRQYADTVQVMLLYDHLHRAGDQAAD